MTVNEPAEVSMLSSLYFGKDDAESDFSSGGLLKAGFLRTQAYKVALAGKKHLIIGRKGSGKSAIGLMIKNALAATKSVSLITPDEISAEEIRRFELAGIAPEQSKVMIWRYVFGVQIAKHILSRAAEAYPDGTHPEELKAIRKFLRDNNEVDDLSIHEKFWRIVERIKATLSLEAFGVKLGADVSTQSPGLRASDQLDLLERNVMKGLEACPPAKQGLLLLVDQIEKVWTNDRDSDLMVIGLLLAAKHVSTSFPHVNCVIFLRKDIYDLLQFADRDKFRGDEMHIDWDHESLVDLIQTRASVSMGRELGARVLWRDIFPAKVADTPIQRFLVQHTLMRPRDIIQLANACRDIAEKNNHKRIEPDDVEEAAVLYSNWKLSDLINEYRINFPFLGDLFVLFTNTGYLVARQHLKAKFDAIREALAARYPDRGDVFSISSILSVLYSIGFIGVIRNGTTVYVYDDANTIEPHEGQFVLHPCFREALRSVSSVAMHPYAAALARQEGERTLVDEIQRERPARRAALEGLRPGRSHRMLVELQRACERLDEAVARANLPDDVRLELRRNLTAMQEDMHMGRTAGDSLIVREITGRVMQFLTTLRERLEASDLFIDKKELAYVLQIEVERLRLDSSRTIE